MRPKWTCCINSMSCCFYGVRFDLWTCAIASPCQKVLARRMTNPWLAKKNAGSRLHWGRRYIRRSNGYISRSGKFFQAFLLLVAPREAFAER